MFSTAHHRARRPAAPTFGPDRGTPYGRGGPAGRAPTAARIVSMLNSHAPTRGGRRAEPVLLHCYRAHRIVNAGPDRPDTIETI